MKWPVKKLGDICEIISGATPSTTVKEYWGDDFFWATPKDLSDLNDTEIKTTIRKISALGLKSCAATLLPINSVLFSSRAPIGLVAINVVPIATNQGFKNLVPNRNLLDTRYLYHWLTCNRKKIDAMGVGATFKEVSKAIVSKIEIPLPPLAEQQRIAALLDTADRILKQRELAIAKLDQLAQSVFVEILGDPVKNTKNFPIENIGELPIHIADGNYSSKYPSASEFVDSGIPFIRANNLKNLTLVNDDVRYITERKHIELAKGHVKFRDVVIVTRGEIGKVGLVPKEFDDANMNAQLVLLRPNSSILLPEYLCHFFNNNYTKSYVKNFETGVALKQLPIGNLKKIKICIPPIALQNKFANIVKKIESQIEFQNNQKFIIKSMLSSLQHQSFAVN